ncbi:17123_t:CDS:10, partial [Racocetra persica]
PCSRCGNTFATNQKFKYHLTERKYSCAPRNILQATVPVSSSELLSNLDSQFQVVKDPNARKSGESVKQWGSRLQKKVKELGDKDRGQPKILAKTKALYDELLQLDPNAYFRPATEEEKHEEQEFFDKPEIEEANLQRSCTQAHREELPIHEKGFLDLDIEVPWPVQFPYNEEHRVIWQNGIQIAKNMFKVDGAEYTFSTWFTEAKEIDLASVILGAENEDEAMQEVYLQYLYQNYSEEEEINRIIKLAVDAYRASDKGSKAWLERAGITEKRAQEILNAIDNGKFLIKVKFIRDDSVYRDKSQTKIAFKIIDKYESIRESKKAGRKYVGGGPNVILTKKSKPRFWVEIDEKFLVREVSEQSERGYGLTEIRRQKINHWEKKMRIPDARVQDVAELEKILKRLIKLLDITHGTIFNSGKYQSGKYKEIGMEAISNALRGPQAIWLMRVGDTSQTISQFVLEDGRTFRTWKKHTEIIEACKQLVNDTIDWQYQERIINKEKKSILSESLKVVDLAEQPVSSMGIVDARMHPIITSMMRSDIQHTTLFELCGEGCGKEKGWASIALLRYLFEFGILESVTIGKAIISLTKQTKVWLPRNRDISCAIIGKFTQDGKIDEKRLTHRLVTDEGELDFLIKDCTDAGTFAGRNKYLLGFILTYYKGYQPQYTYLRASILAYAHINLLEMLQRFDLNEVVRIATDSIYIRKEALYKIKNIPAFFKQVENSFIDQTPMLFHINQKNKKSEKFNPVNGVTKNRHWESIKNIPENTAPSIHDPITRCQKSYLNGGGGSGKTTYAIRIFKNINMVVFTHTNTLTKDFQEKRDIKAQTWHSFFRWNGVGEWTPEQHKYQVICCGDDAQPPLFFGKMLHNWLKEHADYYKEERLEKEYTPSDCILSAHHLSQRIVSQKYLELHRIKYLDLPVPLIYRPRDGRKQNCLISIPGSSEKQELVKNDIVYLPLNTLPEKFIKDICALTLTPLLTEEKILD